MTPGVDVGTEQTNVSPWCVDNVDALTLAVSLTHTVLGAISAAHHGWPENVANYGAEYRTARVREVDVGIVQTLSNQNSRVTIGFKLVGTLCRPYERCT